MGHFHQAEARFKTVRMVTHKTRPQIAPRNQFTQVRHHLATVTYAKCQRLRAVEERFELVAYAIVEQNRFRPAFTRAQHVTVRETATGNQRLEITQPNTASQQIAHMHINRVKARAMERRRHLNVGVHALFAQYGNLRTCAGSNIRRGDIFIDIERQFHVQTRVGIVGFCVMFLIGTFRVVAQALHLPGRFRPPGTKRGAAFAEDDLPVGFNHKTVAGNGLT